MRKAVLLKINAVNISSDRRKELGDLAALKAVLGLYYAAILLDPAAFLESTLILDWGQQIGAGGTGRPSAIFGDWLTYSPDPAGQILGSPFDRFTSLAGINGLAREAGHRLDLLAVHATTPGTGQFREFIKHAQAKCERIKILHERSEILATALPRYGFTTCMLEENGEFVSAWEWEKKP